MDCPEFLDLALHAARNCSGTLEDRLVAFLLALPLPAPSSVGQYGFYNSQLLAYVLEEFSRDSHR